MTSAAPAPAAAAEPQTARTVVMVRPAAFGFNAEAAASNAFAHHAAFADVRHRALVEFDGLVAALRTAGVEVLVLDDTADPPKPDAVFPNNWLSLHAGGEAVLYPLTAASRRQERRPRELEALLVRAGRPVRRWIDLTALEAEGAFLESTGSLVLDRPGRTAYACLSARTTPCALDAFAAATGYHVHAFQARDRQGRPIYHTNVLMSLGARFAAVCLEAVDAAHRGPLRAALEQGGREIIGLSRPQVAAFAANILELATKDGSIVAMSSRAHEALRPDQRAALERLAGPLVHAPIPTIETVGGGGVRCMLLEAPLPQLAPISAEAA